MFIKALKSIIYAICVALTIWVAVSFIDIVSDNSHPNPQHSDLNFFYIITKD